MAEYSQITDPPLQTRIRARYATDIDLLHPLGFRLLAFTLEALAPYSAVLQLPVLLLALSRREVLIFPRPFRLAVANVLLGHSDPPTIALCMGLGVKLYTAFTNNTQLISSTFQSQAVPGPTSSITRIHPFPSLELAWTGHKERVREWLGQSRVPHPGVSFETYVAMSRREEDLSQYQ